ncbi:MAG: hypothetical protein ACI9FN_002520 [Saprospiraceae bacterium]|jgi:hypothetical protein
MGGDIKSDLSNRTRRMIKVYRFEDLLEPIRGKLNAYVNGEFGHIPIVNETELAMPDWTIIYY